MYCDSLIIEFLQSDNRLESYNGADFLEWDGSIGLDWMGPGTEIRMERNCPHCHKNHYILKHLCFSTGRIQHCTKKKLLSRCKTCTNYSLQIVQVHPTVLQIARGYELKVKYPYSYARIVTIVTFFIKLLRLVHPTTLQKAIVILG